MFIRLLTTILMVLCVAFPALAQSPTLSVMEGAGRVISLREDAASVFVGDPGIADVQAVSPRSLYVSGVSPGVTNVLALNFEDRQIVRYTVHVTANNSDAGVILREQGGGVSIRQSGNTAVLHGTANSMDEALAALQSRRALERSGRVAVDRSTLKGGSQISLRVRFVEASRQDLSRLGFDLSALGGGSNPIRLLTGTGIASDFVDGTIGMGDYGVRLGGRGTVDGTTIDGVLSALERKGIVQILSEPTLTTTSGVRANFSAGGEFAYPVNQGNGVISAAYKSYGVSIDFLPTLLPNNRIALEVAPEVSFIDPDVGVAVGGFEAPSLSVRKARTTVEVGSGQTFAIAGLYEQVSADMNSGLPGMSKAGALKGLFGTQFRRRDERELVIFITPYLAKASDAIAHNRNERPSVVKSVGFIVE